MSKKCKSELEKFNRLFEKVDENKREVVTDLINNAVFMAEELRKLQKLIKKNGCVEEYRNGANQSGKKKSSEVEVYNSMIKNYASVVKQLLDLLPEADTESDELIDFLGR